MVTLLLTFFVLLLSLAQTKNETAFFEGREAFVNNIKSFGIGRLYGQKEAPDFGHTQEKHYIEDPNEDYEGRTISAREDKLRRTFLAVDGSMTTMRSQISAKETNYTVTNIRFVKDRWDLDEDAKAFLNRFSQDLISNSSSGAVSLYILGISNDVKTEKQKWIISARRAKAVADCLKEKLISSADNFNVYSWGAGPGGEWVGKDSPISKDAQILIGVLR
jgi:outer membrane protein OmpA-like peptidoglycan-associated protein